MLDRVENFVKRHYIIISFFILLFVILVPTAVVFLILNNDVSSKATNDGWASYFGSFFGGVIGGTGTLIAVALTLWQTEKNSDYTKKLEEEKLHQMKINNIKEQINDYSNIYKNINICHKNNDEMLMKCISKSQWNFDDNKQIYNYLNQSVNIIDYLEDDILIERLSLLVDIKEIYQIYKDNIPKVSNRSLVEKKEVKIITDEFQKVNDNFDKIEKVILKKEKELQRTKYDMFEKEL